MSALAQFGVVPGELGTHHTGPDYPKPVQGRVVHIDADFMAYQVAAESKEELSGEKPRKSLDDMFHNARVAAEHIMRLAGATSYVCHTTPSGSDKGGRPSQAVQQEYQANRAGREKPEFLDDVRRFIGRELNGRPHLDQEADDGMAQALYEAEDRNLVVIASKDKDLRMVPGLHLDTWTGEIHDAEPDSYGSIWIDDSKSAKKLVGLGPAFFWAQVLMGDSADHIKGLPAIPGHHVARITPTKAYNDAVHAIEVLGTVPRVGETKAITNQRKRSLDVINAFHAKTKKCGPVAAYQLLDGVDNHKDAFHLVKSLFVDLGEAGHEFLHWRTGEPVTPTQALLGDMQLLWMRRRKDPNDVVHWIKEQMA